ncbi:hypothetical protein EG329_012552 [Mollisiaceae sp. DMI_Dod_QoI]|nr:hypothetical protein EG329_012552 [Helotiales sp. DMI_Dod_QoI]
MKKALIRSNEIEVKEEPPQYEETGSKYPFWPWMRRGKLWDRKQRSRCSKIATNASQSLTNWVQVDGWKPATLRAPILGTMVVVSLALITLLEVLSHISARNDSEGGIAFAADVNSFSAGTAFGYLYLPTILAVCFSMLWTWIDLDVKRLEPWFQLSQEGGAPAMDSLLLEYPFDFLPFIPITAMRRKHWGVFFAGSVMVMVLWIVTPLQSAIFNTGTVSRNLTANMITNASLSPFTQQSTALNANFMNMAYAISWLDQRLPPYTARDLALFPFQPTEDAVNFLPTESWSTTADVFYTNLTCSPAEVQLQGLSYTFSNGKGCTVPDIALTDTQGIANYMVNYIGYFDNAQVDWSLQNPNCSAAFSNNFLALWAPASSRVGNGVYSNLTALFCEPTYASQQMFVTVNASTGAVHQAISIGGNSSTLPLATIFNITNFEFLLATGVSSISERANFQDSAVLQQYARVKDYSITWPVSNMVGFAVASNTGTIQDLSVPTNLQLAFERAHQLLFTAAFSTLLGQNATEGSQYTRVGVRQDRPGAIILVRPISIAVETALGIIVLFTSCLWYILHHRYSSLASDPATISDIMSLLSTPTELSNIINDDDTLTSTKLASALSEKKYHLGKAPDGQTCILPVSTSPHDNDERIMTLVQARVTSNSEDKSFIPVRPVELTFTFGSVFIGTIVVALACILFLGIWTSVHNGISLPSSNAVVRSIIENYAPTMLATLIEPVWTILNRLLCVLEPFEELRRGKAQPSRSIEVKYTSLPPQLAFWRALRAGDIILASVCIIALSSNVLAVALSGLLNENPASVVIPVGSSQNISPHFNGTPIFDPTILSGPAEYFDPFYIVMSNLTESTPLPPWVDRKLFYLPFTLKNVGSIGDSNALFQSFRGSTVGFGSTVTCTELAALEGHDIVQFEVNGNGSSIQFSTSHILQNGTEVTCVHPRTAGKAVNETTNEVNAFISSGPLALEAVQTMQPLSNTSDGGFCAASLVMGWARVEAETAGRIAINASLSTPRNTTSTFLSCSQKLSTAHFEVEVDSEGRIISSNRTSDFDLNIDAYFTPNVTLNSTGVFQTTYYTGPIDSENHLFQQSSSLIASFSTNDFQWHNDTVTADWMNALLTMVQDSTGLVNPEAPLPNATAVGPQVEALYEQLFAILLSLNTQVFGRQDETPIMIQAIFVESRIFVSETMFLLTVIILSLHLFVAFIYYIYRPTRFLPRMPTSIASIIAFVSTSRAVADYGPNARRHDEAQDRRYGYGRFAGTDGKTHVGIEQQRFVVPLESRNPEVRRRRLNWRREQDERQPRTWI